MRSTGHLLKILLKSKGKLFALLFLFCALFFCHVSNAKDSDYIGSEKCKDCHVKQFTGWSNTLHSSVVKDAKKDPSVVLGDFSDERAKEFAEKYDIEFTVGSHWQQRYLTKIKDDYFALPIVWSVVTRSWENYSVSFWNKKPYSKFCIGCHTTNYNPEDKSYTEHHIGCEACHGPGKKHLDSNGDEKFIVNPAKLTDDRRDMVCAACHVKGEDKSKKYKFPIGYKPGENLADYIELPRAPDETNEQVIATLFKDWKKNRKSPKECSACGINKPERAVEAHDPNETSTDFCFGCHNFKDKFYEHTHHSEEVDIICNDCHKSKKNDNRKEEVRNIHSYDYYMVHKTGCYDPYIEKQCIICHKDKTKDWATAYVIDWSVPSDFIHNE